MKIIGATAFALTEFVLILLIVFAFVIRHSSFQTFLGKKAAVYLSDYLNAEIRIDKIDIAFYDQIYIDGVYLSDHHLDTLGYVGSLRIDLDMRMFTLSDFPVEKVHIDKAQFYLKRYKNETFTNLQFLIDAFASDQEKEATPFQIALHDLTITDSRFVYHDYNAQPMDIGINFSQMDVAQLELKAKNVIIGLDDYQADLQSLSFQEKSGFSLNHFEALAKFNDHGLVLDNCNLKTNYSNLLLPRFHMQTADYSSYTRFLDDVSFETVWDTSSIDMRDIVYFAPMLNGMNQKITLHGTTHQPIARLQLEDFTIKTGLKTFIYGQFNLPDFTNLAAAEINQKLMKYYIDFNDFEGWMLPGKTGAQTLRLPDQVKRLGYLTGKPIELSGSYNDITIQMGKWQTNVGDISFLTPVLLHDLMDTSKPITFACAEGNKKYLRFENFNIGKLLDIDELGIIQGTIGLQVSLLADDYFKIKNISGNFRKFYAAGYNYENILLSNIDLLVDFKTKTPKSTIDGVFYIRDEHLDFDYKGVTTFGEEIDLDVEMNIQCAELYLLHPSLVNRGELFSQVYIKGKGKNIETFTGEVVIDSLYYRENQNDFRVSHFETTVVRESGQDALTVRSNFLDLDMNGYVDLDLMYDNILYQSSKVFPAFFADLKPTFDLNSKFDYDILVKNINPILNVFYPEIQVAKNTKLSGSFDGKTEFFELQVLSDYVSYNTLSFEKINLFQQLSRGELLALYRLDYVRSNDSILAQELNFTNIAANGFMDSQLIFHDKWNSQSNLEWFTHIFEADGFDIDILPSYFNINNHLWRLKDRAHINFSFDCFFIEKFKLQRDEQFIEINGQLSKIPDDKLFLKVSNLDLTDFGLLLAPDNKIEGVANISGYITEPFSELKFAGNANIQDLAVDGREVGDVDFEANYDIRDQLIAMSGSIYYKQLNQKTFQFSGNYRLKQEEKLDLTMSFDETDISVVNSFLDPKVVSGIRGRLNGKFDLKGNLSAPRLEGAIDLKGGRVNLALLGADFFYEGKVKADRYGIYIDAMPISDEEGNTGFLAGQLLHDNFSNFLYELNFDFENHPRKRNPFNPSEPLKIDRFLVMKTTYQEGALYYGNAYATGNASISGSIEDMTIRVNAKTRRGTWINFPMYGPTTIEEDGFIKFKTAESLLDERVDKGINFSGVQLSLNFEITPDARVKLIFDENIGDEITANGEGNLEISLDNYGEIALNGTYRVTEGVYNFAMGPYKQNFFIVPGGTVQWTGDPFSARLDIETFYRTTANLSVVMMDVVDGKTSENEEILSYLKLRGDMNKPEISFDLAAPKANEAGKAVMNRIRSDKDELNRQFFSILIWRRFQPLAGQENRAQAAGGNAALDLVSTQINSLLSKVSEDYKMNVNLENDELTGESSVEFGVTKGFMDDRLIVSGSFGVGSYNQNNSHHNNLIYDLSLEYLINDKGTFRVNVFNESNANSVVQNTNRGQYTQGVGVNYREEFYNLRDFKLFQFISDIFRKGDNKKLDYRDKSRFRPIPVEYKMEEKNKNVEQSHP